MKEREGERGYLTELSKLFESEKRSSRSVGLASDLVMKIEREERERQREGEREKEKERERERGRERERETGYLTKLNKLFLVWETTL